MITKSRAEWVIIIVGLMTVLVVLIYCGWRITLTQNFLKNHMAYIQSRDIRWEELERQVSSHLSRQDESLKEIQNNQAGILKAIEKISH